MEHKAVDRRNNTSPSEQLNDRCLFVEFRVYFDPRTNQDLLHEMADAVKDRLYDLFEGTEDESSGPLPSPHDVTFELVMIVDGDRKPRLEALPPVTRRSI